MNHARRFHDSYDVHSYRLPDRADGGTNDTPNTTAQRDASSDNNRYVSSHRYTDGCFNANGFARRVE